MKNDQILDLISDFCRQLEMAESTFGRRAVNDGKLVNRLREGKRITIDTLDRIQAFIAQSLPEGVPPPPGLQTPIERRDPRSNFRFFENRQKYLLFVHTCSEKRVIADPQNFLVVRGDQGCPAAPGISLLAASLGTVQHQP